MMSDLAFAIPGVDEAMGFAEIMKHVKSMEYSVIVFDTAPTGHTLRFLSFPTVLEKALAKFSTLGRSFGPMLNQMTSMMGGGSQPNQEDMFAKLESMRAVINEVNTQFKDPEKTTFICVCISEFLSVYETERLIQELTQYEIDTHAIVVNQLLYPPKGEYPAETSAIERLVHLTPRPYPPLSPYFDRLQLRPLSCAPVYASQVPRLHRRTLRRRLPHRKGATGDVGN
jgi:TRC40/GET3/ArsA family transport-energizing ATPase